MDMNTSHTGNEHFANSNGPAFSQQVDQPSTDAMNSSSFVQDDQFSNSTSTDQPADANLLGENLISQLAELNRNGKLDLNLAANADIFSLFRRFQEQVPNLKNVGQDEINSIKKQRETNYNQYVKPLDDLIHAKEVEYGLNIQSKEASKSERSFKTYVLKGNEIKGTGKFRNHPDMKAHLKGTTKGSVEETKLLEAILKP